MIGSVPGLENLKETYSECTQTKARLDVYIDKIKKLKDKTYLKESNLKDLKNLVIIILKLTLILEIVIIFNDI